MTRDAVWAGHPNRQLHPSLSPDDRSPGRPVAPRRPCPGTAVSRCPAWAPHPNPVRIIRADSIHDLAHHNRVALLAREES